MVKVFVPLALPLDGADRDADRFGRLFERVALGDQLAELRATLGRHDPAAAVRVVRFHVASPLCFDDSVKSLSQRRGGAEGDCLTLCVSAPLRENSRFAMSTWTEVHVSEAGGPISTQKFADLFFGIFAENFRRRGQFWGGVCRFGEAAREGVGSLLPLASFHSMERRQRQKAPTPWACRRCAVRRIGRRRYRGLTPTANPSRRVRLGKREGDWAGRLVRAEATRPGGERWGGVSELAGAASALWRGDRRSNDEGFSIDVVRRAIEVVDLGGLAESDGGGAGGERGSARCSARRSYRCCYAVAGGCGVGGGEESSATSDAEPRRRELGVTRLKLSFQTIRSLALTTPLPEPSAPVPGV